MLAIMLYFVAPHLGTAIALIFILAMLLQTAAFATFIQEIRLASRTFHIRNEVLFHQAEEEEDDSEASTGA